MVYPTQEAAAPKTKKLPHKELNEKSDPARITRKTPAIDNNTPSQEPLEMVCFKKAQATTTLITGIVAMISEPIPAVVNLSPEFSKTK